MHPHPVSSLADFFHQRGRGLRRGFGEGDRLGGTGLMIGMGLTSLVQEGGKRVLVPLGDVRGLPSPG